MAGQYKCTYAKNFIERDVYSLSIERIERLYKLFDTIVVMFSGGKDFSTVSEHGYDRGRTARQDARQGHFLGRRNDQL